MRKFKVGDVVVNICHLLPDTFDTKEYLMRIVKQNPSCKKGIVRDFDGGSILIDFGLENLDSWSEPFYELEVIVNSPLYQALNEKVANNNEEC